MEKNGAHVYTKTKKQICLSFIPNAEDNKHFVMQLITNTNI